MPSSPSSSSSSSSISASSKSSSRLLTYTVLLLVAVFVLVYLIPFNSTANNPLNKSGLFDDGENSNNNNNNEQESNHKNDDNQENSDDNQRRHQKKNNDGIVKPTALANINSRNSNSNNNNNNRNQQPLEHYQTDPIDDLPFIKNEFQDLVAQRKVKVNDDSVPLLSNMYKQWRDSFNEERLREGDVVPAMVIPTFHDSEHLRNLLSHFDTPVRHVTFICNAADPGVYSILGELQPLVDAGAVSVFKRPHNAGFSAAINLGLRRGKRSLTNDGKTVWSPTSSSDKGDGENNNNNNNPPLWFFNVNCDSIFRPGSAQHFARATNKALRKARQVKLEKGSESGGPADFAKKVAHPDRPGLFYTSQVDHFCFGISDEAVEQAGEMDESFYPAYMEDVDWRWRVHLAGFSDFITHADIGHHRSVNLKKAKPDSPFMRMLGRTARGWEYGRMKWGLIVPGRLRNQVPPTGRTTPFGIPGAPQSLWKVDPAHRRCVETGRGGPRFIASESCWFNGTVLLDLLPAGTKLPEFLQHPVLPMGEYYEQERKMEARRQLAKDLAPVNRRRKPGNIYNLAADNDRNH